LPVGWTPEKTSCRKGEVLSFIFKFPWLVEGRFARGEISDARAYEPSRGVRQGFRHRRLPGRASLKEKQRFKKPFAYHAVWQGLPPGGVSAFLRLLFY
jgi:hypothetical protein